LQVVAAQAAVQQAEAALEQAKSAQDTLAIQLGKIDVTASASGVITTLNLEVGEIVSPGGIVMTIGQLIEVKLIVYIPETAYGKIYLGDIVTISVDSFPGENFSGTVTRIADKAEFTPRNVQTEEGRSGTVYAIELTVPNPDLKLKPGMPADVVFDLK
jgi:HlyD family secretion protein